MSKFCSVALIFLCRHRCQRMERYHHHGCHRVPRSQDCASLFFHHQTLSSAHTKGWGRETPELGTWKETEQCKDEGSKRHKSTRKGSVCFAFGTWWAFWLYGKRLRLWWSCRGRVEDWRLAKVAGIKKHIGGCREEKDGSGHKSLEQSPLARPGEQGKSKEAKWNWNKLI